MLPIYRGFSSVGVSGVNTRLTDKELIKADLLNMFYIRPGEVPGWPSVGSIVPTLMSEPLDEITKNSLLEECARVVSNDPRVQLVSMDLIEGADGHSLTVNLLLYYVELDEQDFLDIVLL